jgi:hypothetical protein
MLRTLGFATVLLSAQVARAQSSLAVFSPEPERAFQLSLIDQSGRLGQCALPAPTWCRLKLSPGELQLTVSSEGRSTSRLLMLPPGESGLKLENRSAGLAWLGLGLVTTGVVAVLESVLTFTNDGLTTAGTAINSPDTVATGVAYAVSAAALLIAGGLLTGFGFSRAGPQAEIVPVGSAAPSYSPPSFAPAPPPGSPPAQTPPPVPWQTQRAAQ